VRLWGALVRKGAGNSLDQGGVVLWKNLSGLFL
jgi:hypothetical protein